MSGQFQSHTRRERIFFIFKTTVISAEIMMPRQGWLSPGNRLCDILLREK